MCLGLGLGLDARHDSLILMSAGWLQNFKHAYRGFRLFTLIMENEGFLKEGGVVGGEGFTNIIFPAQGHRHKLFHISSNFL